MEIDREDDDGYRIVESIEVADSPDAPADDLFEPVDGYIPTEEVAEDFTEDLHDGGDFDNSWMLPEEPGLVSEAAQGSLTLDSASWDQLVNADHQRYKPAVDELKLPWEQGVMGEIFGASTLPSLPSAMHLSMTSVEDLALQRAFPTEEIVTEELPTNAAFPKIVQNIKDLEYFENKRRQLDLACAQWLEILGSAWDCSSTGQQIAMDLQYDNSGRTAVETLRSVFGTKSPATLLKRASTVRKFLRWCEEHHPHDAFGKPRTHLPFEEALVWDYFLYLRGQSRMSLRGYTAASTFLESVRFSKFTLGFFQTESILESKRLLGFAAVEKRTKGPSKQAPAMELEHLTRLHETLERADNNIDRLGAGVMLVCVYARARWSDLRYIQKVEIERRKNGCLVMYTREHKTCSVGERREQYLPLIVPWHGVTRDDWISTFLSVYEEVGLDITKEPLGPLLPAPKLGGGFLARPLMTGEASNWLRMLLDGTSNCSEYRSHSMKCTLLVWAARAGLDREVRAVLGHHCSALTGSEVVYSRNLQTRAIRKLQMLLHRVRVGLNMEDDLRPESDYVGLSAGMTPRPLARSLQPVAPETPPALGNVGGCADMLGPAHEDSVVERALSEMQAIEDREAIKEELEDIADCALLADEVTLFGATAAAAGLIEIDSSSGSDSSSDSSSSSTADSMVCKAREREPLETVPDGFVYYKHRKSMIMHEAKVNGSSTTCHVRLSPNLIALGRRLFFKYPKCLRCFPGNTDRIRSVDQLNKALEASLTKVSKSDGPQ